LFETSQGDGDNRPRRFSAFILDQVQASNWHVGKRSSDRHETLFTDLDGDSALENVKTLLIRPPATPDPCFPSRRIAANGHILQCRRLHPRCTDAMTAIGLTWRAARRMFNIR
jgi:hypothetical protein